MVFSAKNIVKFLVIFIFAMMCCWFGHEIYLHAAYPLKFYEHVVESCEKYGVEKELAYAVIKVESKFVENAVSRAGAIGLMQIMPETFDWLQKNSGKSDKLGAECLYDVKTNIDYGVYLLSILTNRYFDESVMLCAYNAGIGNVDKWLTNPEYSDDGETLKKIPFEETKNYVFKVKKCKKAYKKLYFCNKRQC